MEKPADSPGPRQPGVGSVCFMVMPYGTKPTGADDPRARDTVDFDALWNRAFEPALRELGYSPVRADQDWGPLIIVEMLERLTLADLVLADLTVGNANVYYEIGVRHAVPERYHCVLTSADWARPLFDLAQLRRLPYPLPTGSLGEDHYQAIRAALVAGVPALSEADSPLQAVAGYPRPDAARARAFQATMRELAELQARIREARLTRDDGERRRLVRELVGDYGPRLGQSRRPVPQAVGLELLVLLRDASGKSADDWKELLAFLEELPEGLRRHPFVREQRALGLSKAGEHLRAIAELEGVLRDSGESSERRGLLGGIYKRLLGQAEKPADRRRYLDRAIESYELGMLVDLNDYYPSSNLPRLYRERNGAGDADRARAVSQLVVQACERARRRNSQDEWLPQTLLGAAFDAGDATKAEELAAEIERSDRAPWKLDTTLQDLERSVGQQPDPATRERLEAVLETLAALDG